MVKKKVAVFLEATKGTGRVKFIHKKLLAPKHPVTTVTCTKNQEQNISGTDPSPLPQTADASTATCSSYDSKQTEIMAGLERLFRSVQSCYTHIKRVADAQESHHQATITRLEVEALVRSQANSSLDKLEVEDLLTIDIVCMLNNFLVMYEYK